EAHVASAHARGAPRIRRGACKPPDTSFDPRGVRRRAVWLFASAGLMCTVRGSVPSRLPMPDAPAPRSLWRSLSKLAPHCARQARDLWVVGLLAASSASLAALEPLTLKALFDRFFER